MLASGTSAAATSSALRPCGSPVRNGPLPEWARGGIHPPTQRIPHVIGRSGAIVAILFAHPLESPPPVSHNNKILWVSRRPVTSLTTLRISAPADARNATTRQACTEACRRRPESVDHQPAAHRLLAVLAPLVRSQGQLGSAVPTAVVDGPNDRAGSQPATSSRTRSGMSKFA